MRLLLRSALLLCFAFSTTLFAQNGYTDDFSGELDDVIWANTTGHSFSIVDETLDISVSKKEETEKFRINFNTAPLDIKADPVLNFKIKVDQPIKLQFDFNVAKTYTQVISVPATDVWVPVSVDLSDAGPEFDLTVLKFIDVWVSKNAVSVNGHIYLDDFVLGDGAIMHANIGGIELPTVYAGTEDVKLFFKDITNASELTVSGADAYIENITVSPIIQSTFSNTAYLIFDVKEGVEGVGQMTVTAVGGGEYVDNSITFDLNVVTNMAPEIDALSNEELKVGDVTMIPLTGISDGDDNMDQKLSITATSSNQAVVADGDISVDYKHGSPYGMLNIEALAAGSTDITLELDDNKSSNNTTSIVFSAVAYDNLNLAPTINQVDDLIPFADGTEKTAMLYGISDGNGDTQTLTFTVTSKNQDIINDASISVTDLNTAEGTAVLHYTPLSAGTDTLIVTVSDDAAGTDNAVKETTIEILVKPVEVYATGHDWSLTKDVDRWGGDSGIEVEAVQYDGADALKVTCTDKWIWGALNFTFRDTSLNLEEHPYVSMDIYSVDNRTLHWLWFYDDWEITHSEAHRNDFPSVTSPDGKARWAEPNEWTTITFDFSGENEMSRGVDDEPVPINAKRIVRILYNYHDAEGSWPRPPEYSGTFYIRNFRVGDKALAPDPFATVDPIPDQVMFENPGAQTVTVKGLTNGKDGLPDVSIESLNAGFVSPTIGAVQPDGTAEISYDPGTAVGEAQVVLTVSATGAQTVTDTFLVKTLTKDGLTADGIAIDMSDRHQVMRGIGTYMNKYYDLYTQEMGATAMRVGIIGNQIESSNDNFDPYVLNRSGLDYNAFDWESMRRMKAMGVETFILTSWSAPGWMKDNHNESWFKGNVVPWEEAPNRTSPFYYDEWAEYFVAAYRMFEEEAGIKLAGIGIQNEPAFYEPYPSAILSPEEFARIIAVLGKRLEDEGIETKLFMPEQVFSQNNYSMAEYMTAVNANPDADKYTDVIAVHGYASDGIGSGTPNFAAWTTMYNQAQEGSRARELWMTETHRGYGDYDDAMWIAMAMYGGFEYGNMGLWTQWGIVGQHIVDGNPTQMLYTVANYARFIKPGAVRVTSANDNDDLFTTAWVDEKAGELVVVAINQSDQPISTYLTGTNIPEAYDTYLTSSIRGCEFMGTVSDSLVVIPPMSVMTLVSKGNKAPTVDPVDDMMVAFDAAQQVITLTGIDPVEADQAIASIEAVSDNTTLIQNPVAGTLQPDGSVSLTFQPETGESGVAAISVTVTDDGAPFVANSTTMVFDVMVYDMYNNMPVVDRVNDQYVMEDAAGTMSVAVTATDGDDGTQSLTGTVSTDNADLITGLTYNNTTHEVEYEVVPEQFGEATISVTITDDGGTGNNNGNQSKEREFKVFVASVNDAPVVTALEDRQIGLNAPEQVINIEGIGMGDTFGPQQSMMVWAESSNPALITPPMVEYGGGSTGVLKFTPIRNEMGDVDITVYVRDDGGVLNNGTDLTSFTFNVEVIPTDVNSPPSMTALPDTTLLVEEGALTISLEGVDDGDEDEDQTITITAESSDEGVVGAPVVNWVPSVGVGSIKLTPVAVGTATITITIKDNGGTNYGGVDTQVYTFVATVDTNIGIGERLSDNVKVYPNPARERAFVELPYISKQMEIRVTDVTGKTRIHQRIPAGTQKHEIELSKLDAGFYTVIISTDDDAFRSILIKN